MDLVELVHTPEFDRRLRRFLRFLKRTYFRVEVQGLENLPAPGHKGVICPNHSGYAGTDAVLLADLIREHTGRRPRILAHRAFFDFSSRLKALSESFGLRKASIENGVNIQKRKHLVILFPEGERGNFKPTLLRYRLQEFRTGFLRIAIESGAPIIPTVIIGAEESHLNLGNVDLGKIVKGLRVPLPLTLLPLPAKWKIRFLAPIETSCLDRALLDDQEALKRLAKKIRRELQRALHQELRGRQYVYAPETRSLVDKIERVLPLHSVMSGVASTARLGVARLSRSRRSGGRSR